jgi:hypothetical protein
MHLRHTHLLLILLEPKIALFGDILGYNTCFIVLHLMSLKIRAGALSPFETIEHLHRVLGSKKDSTFMRAA